MIGWTAAIAATLTAGSPGAPIDFDTQIVPILTKAGCNAGSCHGAVAGRGGFHLSLLGGDPAADHDAIVRQYKGRRINLAHPRESLLLKKATGGLNHGGDIPLDEGGAGAERLHQWIAAGAPRGGGRRLTSFQIEPATRFMRDLGEPVRLRATARFSDGQVHDVTQWAVVAVIDPASVSVDDEAVVTVRRRGRHAVMVRFLDRIVPVVLTVPLTNEAIDLSNEPRVNFIDDEVYATLTQLGVPPSPPVDDAGFLRRATLDLTGRMPTPQQVERFIADDSPDKRAEWVERLLSSEAFADYWAMRLATLLRVRVLPNDRAGARAYHEWLRRQIAAGVGWDAMARQLLLATGDSHEVGPANFARMVGDARAHAELVSSVFLASRLQCANCHNHPLDRWTQDDYHGLAAVFARVERGRIVSLAARGAVTNLRTGEPAVPRIPGERDLDDPAIGDARADPRVALAEWMVQPDNPLFARAMVNRLWRAMFGRGLVEPADDLRDTNPPTHPALLDRLAGEFVEHGYDIRHVLRRIALSRTYGRSAASLPLNAADDRFYSHALYRPLEPQVLADAIADVTGQFDAYGDEPLGTRAVSLFDVSAAASLDVLGLCGRDQTCEGSAVAGGLPAKLHLLNGELINRKITAKDGRLHRLLDSGVGDEAILRELYLRALGRGPTGQELRHWRDRLAAVASADRAAWFEDFTWGLLNSIAFTTNH